MRLVLNEQAARVHLANKKWWINLDTGEPLKRNSGELFMLVVSELAESLEGHRKSLPDDKLPHRSMAEVEIADALIRCLDIAGGWKVKLNANSYSEAHFTGNYGEDLLCLVTFTLLAQKDPLWRLNSLINAFFDFAAHYSMDLVGAYEEKMAYNATRLDHSHEHRKGAHGKKY